MNDRLQNNKSACIYNPCNISNFNAKFKNSILLDAGGNIPNRTLTLIKNKFSIGIKCGNSF